MDDKKRMTLSSSLDDDEEMTFRSAEEFSTL